MSAMRRSSNTMTPTSQYGRGTNSGVQRNGVARRAKKDMPNILRSGDWTRSDIPLDAFFPTSTHSLEKLSAFLAAVYHFDAKLE